MIVEEDKERRKRGRRFSTDDKRKERLTFEGQRVMILQQHRDERKKELAQRRDVTQSEMYCAISEDIS